MVPAKKTPDGKNIHGRDNTLGGYSDVLVVNEDFVLEIPQGLAPEVAAPILCADVTVFTTTKEKLGEAARLGVTGVLEEDKDALKR